MSTPDALLATARAGDEGAYRRLVEPHRRELQAHCYRMLGSLHDSEDALQDALLQEVTSFIARSAEGLSPDELARFPTQPPDAAKVESIFVRCGLPSGLD